MISPLEHSGAEDLVLDVVGMNVAAQETGPHVAHERDRPAQVGDGSGTTSMSTRPASPPSSPFSYQVSCLELTKRAYSARWAWRSAEILACATTTVCVGCALTGLAELHAAEARAMVGERSACERSLERAQDHFGRISDDEPVEEIFSETALVLGSSK
ncbi:hypothetical protein ACFWN2_06060 [Lentzea sp. NPDC058436]|uniref:hypothetical protein n=1 Tax=Lentzea sp. NPDC058436 TaxID=3346499 RepID=UPI00365AA830